MNKFLILLIFIASTGNALFANGDPTNPSSQQKAPVIRLDQNYPNPANIKTYIKLNYTGEEVSFRIYDVLGKLVEEIEVIDKTIILDVSSYPDGIYLYTLEVDGEKITRRMTVKHDR